MNERNGPRTSEFWLSLLGGAIGLAATYAGVDPEQLLTATGPLMAYIVSRGIAKRGS